MPLDEVHTLVLVIVVDLQALLLEPLYGTAAISGRVLVIGIVNLQRRATSLHSRYIRYYIYYKQFMLFIHICQKYAEFALVEHILATELPNCSS